MSHATLSRWVPCHEPCVCLVLLSSLRHGWLWAQPDVVIGMPLTLGFAKNIAEKLAVPMYMTHFSQSVVSGYYDEVYMPEANILQRTRNLAKGVGMGLSLLWANRNGLIQMFGKWRKDVRACGCAQLCAARSFLPPRRCSRWKRTHF